MIRFYIAILSVFLGSSAMAETYYDILKSEYKAARDGIDFTDFDRPGHPEAKVCVEIHPDRPNDELLVQIGRFTMMKEGQGPLLPGKEITKVIYRRYATTPFRGDFENTTSSDGSRQVDSELVQGGNWVWKLSARKTYDTVVFFRDERKVVFDNDGQESGETAVRYYGYCYKKGAPEKERP